MSSQKLIMSEPPQYLANLNSNERDKHIIFEEIGHKYTIKGETGYTSVTTLIAKLFEHFDADKIIDKMFENPKKMADPKNKYFGMSKQDILDMWAANGADASKKGTAMHNNIEKYYNGIEVEDDSIEYGYFKNFLKDFPDLKPYRTEWCTYDEEFLICGSIDMVFIEKDGSLLIYDWKRVKEITFEPFNNKACLVPGLKHVPDTSFAHYSIQLNIYRFLLQKCYGKTVQNLYLVIMHPDAKNYERLHVPMMDEEIAIILEWWSKRNKKNHS
jgi:ATP-dependent exoDNAse (exonuclease V) beta subunit